jgi:hypothetical protein
MVCGGRMSVGSAESPISAVKVGLLVISAVLVNGKLGANAEREVRLKN